MKKTLLLIAIGLTCMSLSAQSVSKNTWGVKVGMNLSNVSMSEYGMTISFEDKVGFHAGVSYEMPICASLPLTLETGLYGSLKGVQQKDIDDKINLFYLELPVLLGYSFDISNDFAFKPFAGLNFGYGLSAKEKIDGETGDNMFGEDNGLKRGDVGIRMGAGFYFGKNFFASVSYEWGILNIAKNSDDLKVKNRNFMVTLGYLF